MADHLSVKKWNQFLAKLVELKVQPVKSYLCVCACVNLTACSGGVLTTAAAHSQ